MILSWLFFLLFASVVGIILWNLSREKQKWSGELIPNCLLTRHPLVFLPGPRTLFFFKKYYFEVPSFLAEHGYEVFEMHLPWRQNRVQSFERALKSFQKQGQKIHLLMHPKVAKEFSDILYQYPETILTITHYKTENNLTGTNWLSRFHNLLAPYEMNLSELRPEPRDLSSLIDKVQKIAEDDFIRGTS